MPRSGEKKRPTRSSHLSFEGAVICTDCEGVMLELTNSTGSCRMFVPYEMLSEQMLGELGEGLAVDAEVDVESNGVVSFTMKMHDADKT